VADETRAERQVLSTPPDVRLAALAARQHGVVTTRQLAVIGIDEGGIRRRVAQGRLHRLHRGVYSVGYPTLTREGRWIAAVARCGQGAVLSHLDAAALWGILDGAGARIHVTAAWNRRVPGLWIHRARRLDPGEITKKDAIPVTTVARTLVDLTDLLGRDRLLRAIRESEFLRLLDFDSLNAAVQRARGRRRLSVLHEALADHRPGQIVRGELEHRFLELVREADLPRPETNVKVPTRRRHYEVDCLWRQYSVAVELDGRDAHARLAAFESDRQKDSALSAIGLRPIRFTWQRITTEATEVIAELDATLAATAGL
jgi:predicted transcriptional regulator of viral defense system/very-short-patch-repair endonuclease